MARFVYEPRHPGDPVATQTLGVAFVAGEPSEVSEDAAAILRGNPWFREVVEGEAVVVPPPAPEPRRGPGRPRKVN